MDLSSNKSAFKFATFVVEATTNGAVPVATVDSNDTAVTIPVTPKSPAIAVSPSPLTVNKSSEPQ